MSKKQDIGYNYHGKFINKETEFDMKMFDYSRFYRIYTQYLRKYYEVSQ
ncbi:hypothetical protein [uncultured Dubosiella sp.]|nr:hypothetical protein [uncultured Dubosiella sp.]